MMSQWAMEEAKLVDLGDDRLNERMVSLLSALGSRPNLSIPAACKGRTEMTAAYRFFDNGKVDFEKVLAPHAQRTLERMAAHEVLLLVQDTSEIDLTRPAQEVQGVGELDGVRRGVLLHNLHAFTPDGTPLGTIWAQCLNRAEGVSHASVEEKEQRRKQAPIEEKESLRWLTGLRKAREAAEKLPQAQCICVADSEADIYEVFAEPRGTVGGGGRGMDWLVRAGQNRALEMTCELGEHRYLRDKVLATPVLYEMELRIRERQAKTQVEDRSRRKTRPARQAKVEVRAATMVLRPPWRADDRTLEPVPVNVVLVREPAPPTGEEAVEWVLVTTLPIQALEQVRLIVEYYCVRWNIEIFFRTLKSGCRIEQRRFEHVERITRCLALYLIVAWRTMFVCRMGRQCPEADCEAIFEPSEWKAVWVAVHRKDPPAKQPTLSQIVHLIASLGGYIKRPNSEPGPQSVWIGLQRMYDLAWGWEAFGPQSRAETT